MLLLIAGGSLFLAIILAIIAHASYRSYYSEVMAARASNFAERILAQEPDFWEIYQRVPGLFSQRLQSLITYEPNTGLYVIDSDGRVLASAGEARNFWAGNYRVDLSALRKAAARPANNVVIGSDPDNPNQNGVIAARPILFKGEPRAWLYVVARSADSSPELPQLMRNYAVRGAITIALITLATGLLVTVGVITLVARPLSELTLAAEKPRSEAPGTAQDPLPFVERNDEIGRMARAFDSLLQKLRRQAQDLVNTDERRRSMIAHVSHDLRTPLTALMGQLETISMKYEQLTPSERERFIQGSMQNAQQLRRLTESLADLAKFESPDLKANREPLAIGDLIEDMIMRYSGRQTLQGRSLKTNYPSGLPWVYADISLLERVLSNLIDNALRVIPENGEVIVSAAEIREQQRRFIRLSVTDNGPGISESDKAQLFEPFFQTSQHRARRGFAGLGLAIVKRIADLHQAPIGIETRLGSGTSIWLDLPIIQAPRSA